MGDECMCEQCRGLSERTRVARSWPVVAQTGRPRGLSLPKRDGLLVAGEAGISILLPPSEAVAGAPPPASKS